MKTEQQDIYQRFRAAGYTASEAQRNAAILTEWQHAEDENGIRKVRLCAEPEPENYFDVYGEPEGYTDAHGHRYTPKQERAQIEAQIERDGCWILQSWWRDEDGNWHLADSVGMCIYDNPLSPYENAYVPDLMRAALNALTAQTLAPAI